MGIFFGKLLGNDYFPTEDFGAGGEDGGGGGVEVGGEPESVARRGVEGGMGEGDCLSGGGAFVEEGCVGNI